MFKGLIIKLTFFIFALFGASLIYAQESREQNKNTGNVKSDRELRKEMRKAKKDEEMELSDDELDKINPHAYEPRRAALLSALIPGAGQIYNGSLWKVPIIYAGFITFFSLARIENERYQYWLGPFAAINDNNPNTIVSTNLPSANNITNLKDQHRRDRDYYYIIMGVWYALNVLEATVDAHLKGFNVKDDVDVSFRPKMFGRRQNYASGVQLTLSF